MVMIKVVEGELVEKLNEGQLDDLINKIDIGYILVLAKKDGKLWEGYIFVENGKVIGVYYTDNDMVEEYGNLEGIVELLNEEDKSIEIYKYNRDKINLMKWLYPEIFTVKIQEETETEKEEKPDSKENYLNIKLDIPLDKLIATNVRDFEKYLEDGKYIVINVYKKSSNGYENGYIIFKGREPIGAAYECNLGVLLGETALKKLEQLLSDEDSIIDVYEYNERKANIILELYPEMRLVSEDEKEKEENKELQEEQMPINEVSREELLKKLGIKEPDEDWVETILEEVFSPSEEELEELKEKLCKEIVERIKMMDGIEDVKPELKIKWENGRYYLFGDIHVKRKRILGIIKKDVDPSVVKFEIDKIIRKHLSKYTSRISINVD
ncbi:DUF2226 domain-containing protein [Methanocaldococcus vulcanius]|nr:DUF2226 domain-containing protein [Methanocaldococcus vulcanius]